jgi:hypothetical protein
LPVLEAAIAWLERSWTEHYPEAGARICYVSPGVTMIAGDVEPVPAELSHLPPPRGRPAAPQIISRRMPPPPVPLARPKEMNDDDEPAPNGAAGKRAFAINR